MRVSLAVRTLGLAVVALGFHLALADRATAQPSPECVCDNLPARSSPAHPRDVCTKTHGPNHCTMVWNAGVPPVPGPTPPPPTTRFRSEFAKIVDGFGRPNVPDCGPDPYCGWVTFLRSESYLSAPDLAGAGFLALAASALNVADARQDGDRLASLVGNPEQTRDIGLALTGQPRPPLRLSPSLLLVVRAGCLRVQRGDTPVAFVVVQNANSRIAENCR